MAQGRDRVVAREQLGVQEMALKAKHVEAVLNLRAWLLPGRQSVREQTVNIDSWQDEPAC